MRALVKPAMQMEFVFDTCISKSIRKADLAEIRPDILKASKEYVELANSSSLCAIEPIEGGDEHVVIGNVTKKDLTNLYTNQMVPADKPAREKIYDKLLVKTPRGLCPYCTTGHALTLDHYLPKSRYSLLTICPFNLVPSCSACNTGKLTAAATTPEKQCLHPYFDHGHFQDEQWLCAEILETSPASIRFFVDAPNHWGDIDKERVKNHFECFDLDEIFLLEASAEISEFCLTCAVYESSTSDVQEELKKRLAGISHINHWKTATFQALLDSSWFCKKGYKDSVS